MTSFEKNQKSGVFVEAGRTAFRMKLALRDNPYKEEPFKTLWNKGFTSESRKFFKRKRFQ